MPIEIKELHIKINVNGEGQSNAESNNSDKSEMIQECLDQVMNVLKNKDER